MVNYYSGPDRGNEELVDGVNLRLPSGKLLDWGNIDFDVNLVMSDAATSPERPAVLRHLHHRRLPRRPAAGQLRLRAVHERAAAQVPLPHPQRLHVALLPVLHLEPEQHQGAVQVHRQRRQLRRQPDHAHHARPSGHRRALRHRRRLLDLPDRLQAPARQPAGDARRRPRPEGHAVAGARRCRAIRRRSGDRPDAGVPRRRLGAERRRAGLHPLLDHAGHQPGAEHADRSRSRSSRRCARASSSSAAPAAATRASRTASASRTARKACRSRGRSRSTGRMRTR